MPDLQNIQLDDVEQVATLYRNVAYHRHVILEGIRRIACRNMLHLGDVMKRTRPRPAEGPYSTSTETWIMSIHAIMLADQGLDDAEKNRFALAHSTFASVRLYFALFYTEIEFFKKWCQQCPWPCDSELVALLNNQGDKIQTLKDFRDTFLHPQTCTASAEIKLLQQDIQNEILSLHNAFDHGLERVRQTIRNRLIDILNSLPKVQQSYCRYLFLKKDEERAINDLYDDIENLSDDEKSWSPNLEQSQIGTKLAKCLAYLIPFRPADSSTPPYNRQSPMDVRHLAHLLPIKNDVPHNRQGKAIEHVVKNFRHYLHILITVGVLSNEFGNSYAKIMGYMPGTDSGGLRTPVPIDLPLDQMDSLVAPGKAALALLEDILQVYKKVVVENPWASVPDLDKILANHSALNSIRHFRNLVFHVPEAHLDPWKVEASLIDTTDISLLHSLFTGLSKFICIIRVSRA